MKEKNETKKKSEKIKLELKKTVNKTELEAKKEADSDADEEMIDERFFNQGPRVSRRMFNPSLVMRESSNDINLEDSLDDTQKTIETNNKPIVYNAPSYSPTAVYNTTPTNAYTSSNKSQESMSEGVFMSPNQEQQSFRRWQEQNIGPMGSGSESKPANMDNYVNLPRDSTNNDTTPPFLRKQR